MQVTSCAVFDCTNPDAPYPVASFALDANGGGHLGYGVRYIHRPDAYPIDPANLPLSSIPIDIRRHNDDSYGVLSDAGPNAWGFKLTSSMCRREKRELPGNAIEWFLNSWHFASGCLGFSTHHTVVPVNNYQALSVSDLNARLVRVIAELAEDPDTYIDHEAKCLLFPGVSLGGVRPKTVVMFEGKEHIAKFSRLDDRFDVPAVEYASLRIAHSAGVVVPDFELITLEGRSVLLVDRFDRTNDGRRRHYISANSILDIDNVTEKSYLTKYSYAGIAEALRPIGSHAKSDSHQLFRRMVLNIMIGNVDDHMRNHAFIMEERNRYRLSPAFDIVPHISASGLPQSIGVGAYGRASTIENALSQCRRFMLSEPEAKQIIEEVRTAVLDWRHIMKDSGVSMTDMYVIQSCFDVAESAEKVQIPVSAPTPAQVRHSINR
jgi:serine/threonine-protein kinase HipA